MMISQNIVKLFMIYSVNNQPTLHWLRAALEKFHFSVKAIALKTLA